MHLMQQYLIGYLQGNKAATCFISISYNKFKY